MNTLPTTEERLWAVLSHLSAIAFGMGILLPIIGWSEQRRKSKYASFQCLQALGYQSLGYTVWVLFSAFVMIVFVIIMMVAIDTGEKSGGNTNSLLRIWMTVFEAIIFGSFAFYFLPPLIAAISCALGKDFRYPILGNRLTKYLGYQQTDNVSTLLIQEHEEHWIVAMVHFSILIIFWGMLAPLTTWVLHSKRSSFLRFQSIQTLIYQAGVTILYLGTIFLYFMSIMIVLLLVMTGWTGNVRIDSPMGLVGIIFLGISLLVLFIIILFVPLLHILGQWAGYRVLKGDNYHYPLIGTLIERWITNKTPVAGDGDLRLQVPEGKPS
ncbi:MAG TPA: DUF4870 domain-containing protein [Anaerolineales bacterium]|nr:DUF4870 domain-containing protein [Anaerolineales bacterium]